MKTHSRILLATILACTIGVSPALGDECKGIVIKDIPGNDYDGKAGTIVGWLHENEGRPDGTPLTYAVHGGSVYPADHIKILNCTLHKTKEDPFYTLILDDTPENAHDILYQSVKQKLASLDMDLADASRAAEAYLSDPSSACGIMARRSLSGDPTAVSIIMDARICQPTRGLE